MIVRVNVHRATEEGVRKVVGSRVNEGTGFFSYTDEETERVPA